MRIQWFLMVARRHQCRPYFDIPLRGAATWPDRTHDRVLNLVGTRCTCQISRVDVLHREGADQSTVRKTSMG